MKIYVNEKGEIKSVDAPIEGLTEIALTDDFNPFATWCNEKICCYKVGVIPNVDGTYSITMMTPYVDTRVIEHYDRLGSGVQENTENISTNNSVTDMILTEIIPSAEGQIAGINEAIDMILTEIIPDLLG